MITKIHEKTPKVKPFQDSQESLGNNSKNTSCFSRLIRGEQKSSILGDGSSDYYFFLQKENRYQKYSLQRTAKKILCEFREDKYRNIFIPTRFKSLFHCSRTPISSTVTVNYSKDHNISWYGSIGHCLSRWLCSVCSSKIASVRAAEVEYCIDQHLTKNKYVSDHGLDRGRTLLCKDTGVYMLTLTFSHHKGDSLEYLQDKFSAVKKDFWRDWSVRNLIKNINYVGRITSHEATYSVKNGFHPHDHILLFTDHINYNQMKKYESDLRKIWKRYLKIHGLYGNKNSLSFRGGNLASQYVVKIGLEATLGHIKRGKVVNGVEHLTFFQMLNYIQDNSWSETLTKEYIKACKEYASVMPGKRQLVYSPGLKKHFNFEELTEKEAIESKPKDSKIVLCFESSDYKKLFTDDIRLYILNYFDKGDYARGIKLLLDSGVRILEINKFVIDHLKDKGLRL